MRAGWGLWAIATAVSAVAHLAVAVGLAVTIRPQPVPPEAPAEARFELSAQPVEQIAAIPQLAEGAVVPEGQPAAPNLPPGTVNMGRAAAIEPIGAPLSASDPSDAVLASQPPPVQTVSSALPSGVAVMPEMPPATALVEAPLSLAPMRPLAVDDNGRALSAVAAHSASAPEVTAVPDQLASVPADAAVLGVAELAMQSARPAPPPAERLTRIDADLVALAGIVPVAQTAPIAALAAQSVPANRTDAPSLPAQPPPAGESVPGSVPETLALAVAAVSAMGERAQAAIAWSGAGQDQIDPISLAAIQSFMQPADIARLQEDDPVRDGISALLASVPCARMQTVFLPERGELELRGHVPDDGLRAPVLAALLNQVGGAIPVADNLRVLPRPQCDVLAGIAGLGLPQSTVQETDPRLVGPDAHAREYHFVEGDALSFEVTTPDYPAHVYIDYFDAEGMVLHLQPNEMLDTVLMDPKSTLTVGSDPTGVQVFTITVAPPFGNEIAVAFAASTPIHDNPRPAREPAGPYLDWLRDRIALARARDPDFKGEWVYFFMSTASRAQ